MQFEVFVVQGYDVSVLFPEGHPDCHKAGHEFLEFFGVRLGLKEEVLV